jgi:lipid-A-disaccharide synthase-like uncharacterized protein
VLLEGNACSGYKITLGDKTFLGSNEDAWRMTPHIWFEEAKLVGKYGAAFTGSRYDGENGYAPQSGMNEMGLAFERLASYHPEQEAFENCEKITNPTNYLKDILHSCASVEEVKAYISRFDHSYFIEDVFIYVDKSGKYLIVEPYTLTIGNDPSYVISNFCPSITSAEKATKLDRYRNGVAFLNNGIDTTLAFCTDLSDAMHVCRKKIGDGTLLSSVWDLRDGTVNLFFYHNYDTTVQFNLKDELKKGNHTIAIEKLFPPNPEFEQLRYFQTTKNNNWIAVYILGSAAIFLFSSVFFLVQYFRTKKNKKYALLKLLLFPIGLVLFYYMYVLSSNLAVFYFPAPYQSPTNALVSLASYIPLLLLVLILPLLILNYRLYKEHCWSAFAFGLFTINNLIYIGLIGLFQYWQFFDVFN